MKQIVRAHPEDRVGLDPRRRAPLARGLRIPAGPEVREPEVQAHSAAPRLERGELLQPALCAARPAGEREADPGLQGAVALKDAGRVRAAETPRAAQVPGLAIGADAQVQDERRRALATPALVISAGQDSGRRRPRRRRPPRPQPA